MAQISAAQVKELRERTSVAMMECKKALVEANGDMDTAIDILRNKGIAQALKKGGRIAADGLVTVKTAADRKSAVLVEVNCETDFVAKADLFKQFVTDVAAVALSKQCADVVELTNNVLASNKPIEDTRLELIAQLGENISVRRVELFKLEVGGAIGAYVHGGGDTARIATVILLDKPQQSLATDLAMHIAAMNPEFLSEKDVSLSRITKEKEIYLAQAKETNVGKPDALIEKIVAGKLSKFTKEITLLGQPFVKDTSTSVENLLKAANVNVIQFGRFEVGEGIEKKQSNFVEEVMAQVKGT
jgi:elongation factor Ts